MTIANADGRMLDMAIRPVGDRENFDVRLIKPIESFWFDSCPICGDPATTDEHVPPRAVGGLRMTRTCNACNHRLGSHAESDLVDWMDQALTLTSFTGDAVRGPRHARRILYRTTADDEFVMVVDGSFHDEIRNILGGGDVEFMASLHDENRMRVGALKHAYLAACLHHRGIPPGTDQIRLELIAARDAIDRDSVPYSPIAAGLNLLRLDPASGTLPIDPLVHAIASIDGKEQPGVLVSGRAFISWSIEPVVSPPNPQSRRFRVGLTVGKGVEGTVIDVARDRHTSIP